MADADERVSVQSLSAPKTLVSPCDERATFTRQAAWLLAFTLVVVLFGAVVRITGSGAGCGKHWPTCQGEIAHLPKKLETLIELSHRVSTGINALLVFVLTWRATRVFASGHPARRSLGFASAMMVVESLIGAALVLLALVGTDASLRRAIVMPLHLLATSGLGAALVLSVFYSLPGSSGSVPRPNAFRSVLAAAAGVLLVSASGAITALGDTVYPVKAVPLAARLMSDQAPASHFLERLRIVHPLLAVAGAALVLASAASVLGEHTSPLARSVARVSMGVCLLQVGLGALNIVLSAPGWMQVIHLLVANAVWLSLVVLAAELAHPRALSLGVAPPRIAEN